MADGEAPAKRKNADLPVRFASALVMLAVVGAALWIGGAVFYGLVTLIAIGLLWEWQRLVEKFAESGVQRMVWLLCGVAYIALGAVSFGVLMNVGLAGPQWLGVLFALGVVISTDVGAYFSGRTIGGPKIAPSISPSKTWAGLIGGMFLASVFATIFATHATQLGANAWVLGVIAAILAVVAQAGDFFESWMKRRAGVKDSSNLIPGHGGLLDRLDGMLPVSIVLAVALVVYAMTSGVR